MNLGYNESTLFLKPHFKGRSHFTVADMCLLLNHSLQIFDMIWSHDSHVVCKYLCDLTSITCHSLGGASNSSGSPVGRLGATFLS